MDYGKEHCISNLKVTVVVYRVSLSPYKQALRVRGCCYFHPLYHVCMHVCRFSVRIVKCYYSILTKLPPKLKCFDAEEFLKTVEHSGPQLTSVLKGNWKGLYR
jgi:hypothetical protein